MSTYYAPHPRDKIAACDLFDGRLGLGVREHMDADQTDKKTRILTDGRNYLLVFVDDDGFVCNLKRGGGNAPQTILRAISEAFDMEIFSEYEHQYWGADTQEEWDAFQEQLTIEDRQQFQVKILKFLNGESVDWTGSERARAEIAKRIIDDDVSLLLPENCTKLHEKIETIYYKDRHLETITLSPQQIAVADMIATHEDDLPSA